MKKFFFLLMILGAGALYLSLNYHFILFDDRVKVLKKTDYSLTHTLVDARGAKALKLLTYPDLVKAGVKDFITPGRSTTIPAQPAQ